MDGWIHEKNDAIEWKVRERAYSGREEVKKRKEKKIKVDVQMSR